MRESSYRIWILGFWLGGMVQSIRDLFLPDEGFRSEKRNRCAHIEMSKQFLAPEMQGWILLQRCWLVNNLTPFCAFTLMMRIIASPLSI